MRLKTFLREPLLHFLAIGAALFLVFAWKGGVGGASSGRIVVTRARIESFSAEFQRAWQRPPTPEEMKGLIDAYVREEAAVRDAMAAGLDRDDTIVRRRLKQKVDFLAEDRIDSAPATDADLAAWLASHADAYRIEERVSFRQVCLTPEKRGGVARAEAEARRLATALENKGAAAEPAGDSRLLPPDVPLAPKSEIGRIFGSDFAEAVVKLEAGRWSAPVPSGFGAHAVFVRERTPARAPALADVRAAVARDFAADRRQRELDALYARLLAKTRVVIEAAPEKK